jgi:hypothetical protein
MAAIRYSGGSLALSSSLITGMSYPSSECELAAALAAEDDG